MGNLMYLMDWLIIVSYDDYFLYSLEVRY